MQYASAWKHLVWKDFRMVFSAQVACLSVLGVLGLVLSSWFGGRSFEERASSFAMTVSVLRIAPLLLAGVSAAILIGQEQQDGTWGWSSSLPVGWGMSFASKLMVSLAWIVPVIILSEVHYRFILPEIDTQYLRKIPVVTNILDNGSLALLLLLALCVTQTVIRSPIWALLVGSLAFGGLQYLTFFFVIEFHLNETALRGGLLTGLALLFAALYRSQWVSGGDGKILQRITSSCPALYSMISLPRWTLQLRGSKRPSQFKAMLLAEWLPTFAFQACFGALFAFIGSSTTVDHPPIEVLVILIPVLFGITSWANPFFTRHHRFQSDRGSVPLFSLLVKTLLGIATLVIAYCYILPLPYVFQVVSFFMMGQCAMILFRDLRALLASGIATFAILYSWVLYEDFTIDRDGTVEVFHLVSIVTFTGWFAGGCWSLWRQTIGTLQRPGLIFASILLANLFMLNLAGVVNRYATYPYRLPMAAAFSGSDPAWVPKVPYVDLKSRDCLNVYAFSNIDALDFPQDDVLGLENREPIVESHATLKTLELAKRSRSQQLNDLSITIDQDLKSNAEPRLSLQSGNYIPRWRHRAGYYCLILHRYMILCAQSGEDEKCINAFRRSKEILARLDEGQLSIFSMVPKADLHATLVWLGEDVRKRLNMDFTDEEPYFLSNEQIRKMLDQSYAVEKGDIEKGDLGWGDKITYESLSAERYYRSLSKIEEYQALKDVERVEWLQKECEQALPRTVYWGIDPTPFYFELELYRLSRNTSYLRNVLFTIFNSNSSGFNW